MKIRVRIQAYIAGFLIWALIMQMMPMYVSSAKQSSGIMFPIVEISKLECRFEDFDTLGNNCKMKLPELKPSEYRKYATQNGGYNDYTRIYTVLWGSSYKYGWDVGSGGHQGVDIATAKGTPVYSMADGTVIKAGKEPGWGKYVSIEHNIRGKKIISNYAHLDKVDVNRGEKVNMGDQIGTVGSTGNSTGNHLHFQIDLRNKFHPYYYDYKKCPYSYQQITETGVCFDELDKNTFDPLEFFATLGEVVDRPDERSDFADIPVSTPTIESNVFNTTVYYGYGSKNDVRKVQEIYQKLGYYKGNINGKFGDLEESIIDYQIAHNIIETRTSDGAGWFGPKTRKQTKIDFDKLSIEKKTAPAQKVEVTASGVQKTIPSKVGRSNLMTREEREAKEMKEFLKKYNVEFGSTLSHVEIGKTAQGLLYIKDKKGRPFKGNTPANVHFEYDSDLVSVFPEKFYKFKSGKRDIKITAKKAGIAKVKIMLGNVHVKTITLSISEVGKSLDIQGAKIIASKDAVIGEEQTAIVVMQDENGRNMIRSEFDGNYSISADSNTEFCIKRGKIKDIKALYKRKCHADEFNKTLNFAYADTVGGVLIFNYKATKIGDTDLSLSKGGTNIAKLGFATKLPKGLNSVHPYFDEIVYGLESGIASGVKNGYFNQDKNLSSREAKNWVANTLSIEGYSEERIKEMRKTELSSNEITRYEFTQLIGSFIQPNQTSLDVRKYRDLENNQEVEIAALLGDEFQWRDKFAENYFQPEDNITRAEALYIIHYMIDGDKIELARK